MRNRRKSRYLIPARLADVLALIQVLALDPYAHRTEDGLQKDLQGPPGSAETWTALAEEHREFFRAASDAGHPVSLVARHVTPVDENRQRQLPADYASKLLQLAVEIHDREMRRSQAWHVWIPVVVAVTAGAFTVFGVALRSWFGCP